MKYLMILAWLGMTACAGKPYVMKDCQPTTDNAYFVCKNP